MARLYCGEVRRSFAYLLFSLAAAACGSAAPASPAAAPTTQVSAGDSAPAAAEPALTAAPKVTHHFPGSRLSVTLPADLKRTGRAHQFARRSPMVLVVVAEVSVGKVSLDEAVAGVVRGSEGKLREVSRERRGSNERVLLSLAAEDGITGQALFVKDGSAAGTVLVVYQEQSAGEAKEILESVALDAHREFDPLALHGLRLDEPGELRVSTLAAEKIVLRKASAPEAMQPGEARVTLHAVPNLKGAPQSDEDLAKVLFKVLMPLSPVRERMVLSKQDIDGQTAHVVSTTGKEQGVDVALHAWVLRDGVHALVGVATVAQAKAARELPQLKAALHSVKRAPLSNGD